MNLKVYVFFAFVGLSFLGCNQDKPNKNINTYDNVKKELQGDELIQEKSESNIEEFEMEVNNGGLNQYFFNAGQNCFKTLSELEKTKKVNTAAILKQAITLINPNNLSEKALINKLQKRKVEELFDEKIIEKLSKLDQQFYRYPDGQLY